MFARSTQLTPPLKQPASLNRSAMRPSAPGRPRGENGAYGRPPPGYDYGTSSPPLAPPPQRVVSNGADVRASVEGMRLQIREDIWKDAAVMITQLVNEQVSDVISENRELKSKVAQLETHSDNLAQWIQHLNKVQDDLTMAMRSLKSPISPTNAQQQHAPQQQHQRGTYRSPPPRGGVAPPMDNVEYDEHHPYGYSSGSQGRPYPAPGPARRASLSPPRRQQQSQPQPQQSYAAGKMPSAPAPPVPRRAPPPQADHYYERAGGAEPSSRSKPHPGSASSTPRVHHRDAAGGGGGVYYDEPPHHAPYPVKGRPMPTPASGAGQGPPPLPQSHATVPHEGAARMHPNAYYPPSPYAAPPAISDEPQSHHTQYHPHQAGPNSQGGPPRSTSMQHHPHHGGGGGGGGDAPPSRPQAVSSFADGHSSRSLKRPRHGY